MLARGLGKQQYSFWVLSSTALSIRFSALWMWSNALPLQNALSEKLVPLIQKTPGNDTVGYWWSPVVKLWLAGPARLALL